MPRVDLALEGAALAALMGTIALGWLLGRKTVRGIALGPAGATLFVAVGLGHLGLGEVVVEATGALSLGALGFALFIYSVGFDAAPLLASSLRERRIARFVVVGASVNVVAALAAILVSLALGLDASTAGGVLSGALTSAPTFAAASETASDPASLTVAFALTYPVGLIGIVVAIQVLPRWLGEDLAREASSAEERSARRRVQAGTRASSGAPELSRVYRVSAPDVVGRSLAALELPQRTGCVVSRLRRGEDVLVPDGETTLREGDHVMAVGRLEELRALQDLLGEETYDAELRELRLPRRRILVRSAGATGRTLAELDVGRHHHCIVTRVERGRLWIEPDADVALARGDVVEVVGRRHDLRELAARLGRFEPGERETDLAPYAGGIVVGLLLGALQVRFLGFDFGLGSAAALLLVGLALGWRERLGPLSAHVPREARQLVRDLGILLFIGETGLAAGAASVAVTDVAVRTIAAGVVVHVAAVIVPLLLALKWLRLPPLDAWGSLCGGMTSSAALTTVRRASDSDEATVSYVGAYAVASLLATLAGPAVVAVLG